MNWKQLAGNGGALAAACLMALSSVTHAQTSVSRSISFQAKATQPNGQPIPDGDYNIQFFIYDDPVLTNGHLVEGPILVPEVPVRGGVLSAMVPVSYFSFFNGENRYLEVVIGSFPAIQPRIGMTSVPRALYSTLMSGGPLTVDFVSSFPPQGTIYEGDWGTYIIAGNGVDREIRIGVENDRYTRAEIRLENFNEAWGRIRFFTTAGSQAPDERMRIDEHGRVGIGTRTPNYMLDVDGEANVNVLHIQGGSDLAEPFPVAGAAGSVPAPGLVVVIDESNPGGLRVASTEYDPRVAGVISGAGGLSPGMVMKAEGHPHADGDHPVALSGRVWVWCDAVHGAIGAGDRLTTSPTPGHAMRVGDTSRADGAVIGKAMTRLTEGRGLVLVLVNLQ